VGGKGVVLRFPCGLNKFVILVVLIIGYPKLSKFLLENPPCFIKLSISDEESAPFQVQSDA
jgi:hypothetical protein